MTGAQGSHMHTKPRSLRLWYHPSTSVFTELLVRAFQDGDISFLERMLHVKGLLPTTLISVMLNGMAIYRQPRLLEYWLERAAPFDSDGLDDALHTSCQQGDTRCTALLLAHGANPASLDDQQRTPLIAASLSVDTVKVLLRCEGGRQSINMADNKGQTALGMACFGIESPQVVALLLEAGADPGYTSPRVATPHVKMIVKDWHCQYKIVKARRLRDAVANLGCGKSAAAHRRDVPGYLESRIAGHKSPPVVQAVTRRRSRRLSSDDLLLPDAVVEHVLHEMKIELFIEMASM